MAATTPQSQSPQWGSTTKLTIVVFGMVIAGFLAWRFGSLVGQFAVAAMLAYILEPVVNWLGRRTGLSHGWAVVLTYLLLIIVGAGFFVLVGVAAVTQVQAVASSLPQIISDVTDLLTNAISRPESQINIGPLHIQLAKLDWAQIETQIGEAARSMIPQGITVGQTVVGVTLNFVGWVSVTLIATLYFAVELPRLNEWVRSIAHQSGYHSDYDRMARAFSRIWNAYLRGQVIVGIVIAVITSVMLAILGVEYWLALGLLSGILQVIPYVGPAVIWVVTILFALFQPSNYLGLAGWQFGLLVAVVTSVVQQVSGYLLLPTVVGDALNMSPLAVVISLIVGGAVAGMMGVILAAPVVASLQVIVSYIWHKLLDLPPFPENEPPPTQVTAILRRSKEFVEQIRNRAAPPAPSDAGKPAEK